jgi:uncharacterized protein (TIGR03067 family)
LGGLAAVAEEKGAGPKGAEDKTTVTDTKSLQGEWVPVKAELAGQAMPEAFLKTIDLKISKNEYEAVVAGKQDKGTWTIDASAKPKGMLITGVKGPNAKKTIPAIYEVTADTLRVCYDLSGKKRPTEFKTKADTMLYLVTYQRKKT